MSERLPEPGEGAAKYTVADDKMAAGSTFGSPRAMLVIKATGAFEKLFAPELGTDVFGALVFHHWDAATGVPLAPRTGTFDIYPDHQRHEFRLSNGVAVHETLFVLSSKPKGKDLREVDPPGAYYDIVLENDTKQTQTIASYASLRMRGPEEGKTKAYYDSKIGGFVACGEGESKVVRIAAADPAPDSVEVTLDAGKASAATLPGRLSGAELSTGAEPIGIFHFERTLKPGESARYTIVLTFSEHGESDAKKILHDLPDAAEAYRRTREYFEYVAGRAIIATPEEEVNRGVQWAKANILRVQNLTQQGWCFVNDPTRSNNSVARDTAWFALGADYLTPHFTRDALLWYLDHTENGGMVVEYFDVRNGKTEDYGLNINDDTPLLIVALWHHYAVTGEREFLDYVWPRVRKCAAYILSQCGERGLVWCTANGTADWGIIGWRNIIKGYRLSGATTEANSECYAALVTMSKFARAAGDETAAAEYEREANNLREAINEHLLDRSRNLYYLNIELDGTPRTDITADLVFPVLFGVAENHVSSNIISRLSSQEFWTDAGLRTVPRTSLNYSPTEGSGLFGGVWSGPTFWFAHAAARYNPEFMAYALAASFRHYTSDPYRNNTVPGQFCEWLHGETMVNQGMMLSPWFAPKYLWAALEGAAGLDVSGPEPVVEPRLANSWNWISARNVPVRGKTAAWFAARLDGDICVFASYPFANVDKENRFDEDVTDEVVVSGDFVHCVALRREDRTLILVGNTRGRTVNVAITLPQARQKVLVRRYNTLRREWIASGSSDVRDLRDGLQVEIERHGFALLELHTTA
ncbi:MAG TPA: hypothetical protein VFL13_05625 [Candidatus Baltobacteraceae bacterium]|nr:hypothetical protein [Candidatus Baltobacteraceae bacterium]